MSHDTVHVAIQGGPHVDVPWDRSMNAQQALERAAATIGTNELSFALRYFGARLGYLVVMINETYDSFLSSAEPFYYWEFFVNDVPSDVGIDSKILERGDSVSFGFERYDAERHQRSTLRVKYEYQRDRTR